jgi:hypothetical protein
MAQQQTAAEQTVAMNQALADAEASLSTRDHFMRIGLWTLASAWVGVFFSQGDEGAQVLEHSGEFVDAIMGATTSRAVLENALERVSRGLPQNDSLKLRLLAAPGLVDRLQTLIVSPDCSVTARNHAVKALEAMSGSTAAQREMMRRGDHVAFIGIMGREDTSLYVRKALATTICNLAQQTEHAGALARAGAIGALDAEQKHDPRLRRRRVAVGLARLATAVEALGPVVLDALPEEERALAARLAEEEKRAAREGGALHSARATLVESGLLLYLHTAGGGAAWGLFESLRGGQSQAVLVQNVARTALVTCLVPILMVGGVVTAYTEVNKSTDVMHEKFGLYFSSCLALYPASRLLTWVERFAPLWLGGHVVGFGSFFLWMLWSESDLLKSDSSLLAPMPVPTTKRETDRDRYDVPLNPFAKIRPKEKPGSTSSQT